MREIEDDYARTLTQAVGDNAAPFARAVARNRHRHVGGNRCQPTQSIGKRLAMVRPMPKLITDRAEFPRKTICRAMRSRRRQRDPEPSSQHSLENLRRTNLSARVGGEQKARRYE